MRIWRCWLGGNASRMRSTVSAALVVWSVESTSCAISAAETAVLMVAGSRISPRRITLGLSRMAERSASE